MAVTLSALLCGEYTAVLFLTDAMPPAVSSSTERIKLAERETALRIQSVKGNNLTK